MTPWLRIGYALLLASALSACHDAPRSESPVAEASTSGFEAPRLAPAEVRARMAKGEAVLVDVRSESAYREAHVPGAINLTWSAIKAEPPGLAKARLVVTYCTCPDDYSARGAARELHDRHGFSRLAVLAGGLEAWEQAGLPTETSQATGHDGASLYATHCATCHQPDGNGMASHFPPLKGNGLAVMRDARPLILVTLEGLDPAPSATRPHPGRMPGFRKKLSDEEMAALLTHVRTSWGNQAPAIAAEDVLALRR